MNKNAFTLSEVLITIGVIGIVACLTIPQIMTNYTRRVLESQFRKSVALIQQVVIRTKEEMPIDKLAKFCTTYDKDNGGYYNGLYCVNLLKENTFKDYVRIDGNFQHNSGTISRDNETIRSYDGKSRVTKAIMQGSGFPIFSTNMLPDGSFLSYTVNEWNLYVAVDTNGQKNPNKLGHDIFIFTIDKTNDTVGSPGKPKNYTKEEIEELGYTDFNAEIAGFPCSIHSTQKANGRGCAYYALRDECPDGTKNSYWKCLP